MNSIVKRYVVWTYVVFYVFLLVIGLTMFLFKSEPMVAEILKVLSAWTATFVFIAMFRRIHPQGSRWDFVRSQFREKLSLPTLLCAVLLQLMVLGGGLVVTGVIRDVPIHEQFAVTSWTTLLLVFGNQLIRGPLGEELGWSGFVRNELQKTRSSLATAVIVGVMWGFWHAPLWMMSGYSGIQLVLYIVSFMVAIIAVSILITAFYRLNRNLVIPIVIHQLFNYFMGIQAGDRLDVLMVTAILYLVVALGMVFVNYKKCLYP